MSMTKRYLESLPAGEQDAILGRFDEWTDDAENEPELTQDEMTELMHQRAKAEVEWARALMEESDAPMDAENEELNDPPVKCRICRDLRPISEMNTNGECSRCQREAALLVKPEPKRVDCDGWSI